MLPAHKDDNPHATEPHRRCRPYPSDVFSTKRNTNASNAGDAAVLADLTIRHVVNCVKFFASIAILTLVSVIAPRKVDIVITPSGSYTSLNIPHIGWDIIFATCDANLILPICIGVKPDERSIGDANLFHPAKLAV